MDNLDANVFQMKQRKAAKHFHSIPSTTMPIIVARKSAVPAEVLGNPNVVGEPWVRQMVVRTCYELLLPALAPMPRWTWAKKVELNYAKASYIAPGAVQVHHGAGYREVSP